MIKMAILPLWVIDRSKYYLQHDQTKPIPVEDETFDYVFSEHLIEQNKTLIFDYLS